MYPENLTAAGKSPIDDVMSAMMKGMELIGRIDGLHHAAVGSADAPSIGSGSGSAISPIGGRIGELQRAAFMLSEALNAANEKIEDLERALR